MEINKQEVEIRYSLPSDAREVEALRIMCWRSDYRDLIDGEYLKSLDASKSYKSREEVLHTGPDINLVAVIDDKIVGFADAGMKRGSNLNAKEGEVLSMYVDGSLRGKGIGALLLQEHVKNLKTQGFQSMWISTLKNNLPAVAFYEHKGGKERGSKITLVGGHPYEEIWFYWDLLTE